MLQYIEDRAIELGQYVVSTEDTVRSTSEVFRCSKSTVHKDISERLKDIDFGLWLNVQKVLKKNKAERHIRGGQATKLKYSKLKEDNI